MQWNVLFTTPLSAILHSIHCFTRCHSAVCRSDGCRSSFSCIDGHITSSVLNTNTNIVGNFLIFLFIQIFFCKSPFDNDIPNWPLLQICKYFIRLVFSTWWQLSQVFFLNLGPFFSFPFLPWVLFLGDLEVTERSGRSGTTRILSLLSDSFSGFWSSLSSSVFLHWTDTFKCFR